MQHVGPIRGPKPFSLHEKRWVFIPWLRFEALRHRVCQRLCGNHATFRYRQAWVKPP